MNWLDLHIDKILIDTDKEMTLKMDWLYKNIEKILLNTDTEIVVKNTKDNSIWVLRHHNKPNMYNIYNGVREYYWNCLKQSHEKYNYPKKNCAAVAIMIWYLRLKFPETSTKLYMPIGKTISIEINNTHYFVQLKKKND